ncbi:hypothetical protein [Pseudoxanthomonas sp. CF125]|uniref:hypothetical protein n=1 Tax=Pseudoxanthomonas sp. CF125 TaxID=1855303 RepID=UPI00115F98D1|nr:hypothetical protein [Pseudoxanthomonas sp. CF125]
MLNTSFVVQAGFDEASCRHVSIAASICLWSVMQLIAPPVRYARKLRSMMAARTKRFVLAFVACIADRQCSKQEQ